MNQPNTFVERRLKDIAEMDKRFNDDQLEKVERVNEALTLNTEISRESDIMTMKEVENKLNKMQEIKEHLINNL